MGKEVIYYGEADGVRTVQARKLVPRDLDIGFVDPNWSNDKKIEAMKDALVLITNGLLWSTQDLAQMPKLKLLQLMSAGFNTLDILAIRQMGIEVSNNSPAIANSVAEHAISLMLMIYKRLEQGIRGVKDGSWQEHAKSGRYGKLYELANRTVGIVGLGNIGYRVAKRLIGFETKTIFYDIREFNVGYLREINAESVPFEVLLDRSDIVTVHVPLNSLTKGLFDSEVFKLMKSNAVFINTCRGPVHDEQSLIRALNQSEIAAAGLDVFQEEPTPTSNPLLGMDNVVVTPHLAGSSQERVDNAIVFSYENARRVLQGQKPKNCVTIDE